MRKIKVQSLSDGVKEEIIHYARSTFDGTNTKLPTEEQFSNLLGVSRITVRSALNELASEGIIFRRQGKGTFLNPEALTMKVKFNPVSLFTEMITEEGFIPSIKILETCIISADAYMSTNLKIPLGNDIVFTSKIFFADGNPCVYCKDYFAKNILPDQEPLDEIKEYENSLFSYLYDKTGRKIIWDRVEISAVSAQAQPEIAHYFQDQSLLLLECINFDTNDKPVLLAYEYVNTDYIRFNSIRQKHGLEEV